MCNTIGNETSIDAKVNECFEIRKTSPVHYTGRLVLSDGLDLIESTMEPVPTVNGLPLIGVKGTEVYKIRASTPGEYCVYYLYMVFGKELLKIDKYVINVK